MIKNFSPTLLLLISVLLMSASFFVMLFVDKTAAIGNANIYAMSIGFAILFGFTTLFATLKNTDKLNT